MYIIKHNIPIDKRVLDNSDITSVKQDIVKVIEELDKYRARLLKFRNTVYFNTKINENSTNDY
jgi:hypothetical protein